MKLCVDCIYSTNKGEVSECLRHFKHSISLVTGHEIVDDIVWAYFCKEERSGKFSGACGPEGRFWESKNGRFWGSKK